MSKTKELSTQLTKEQLAFLDSSYPVEESFSSVLLPRLGMYSQDKTEGKGKQMKVVAEAGTFYTEKQTEEVDAKTGKKIWAKVELGNEIEAIILFERKQLSYYDSANQKYVSSPIYDADDQIIPLFKDKKEIDRGTPAELKSREEYQGKSAKGKDISKLEDIKVLYVLYEDEVYQLNLRGTSMFAFKTYKRGIQPNKVLTRMNSASKENGSTEWNQMTFDAVRGITGKEAGVVIGHLKDIQAAIAQQAAFYANKGVAKKTLPKGEGKKDDDDF